MLKLTAKKTKWFPVTQDPSGESQVEILHLKPGEVSEIEARTNQIVGKQEGDNFHTEISFSLNERTKKYVDRAVVGLKGFVDIKGKNLECTTANKALLLKEYDWFGEFVDKCRQELAEEVEAETEEAEKN